MLPPPREIMSLIPRTKNLDVAEVLAWVGVVTASLTKNITLNCIFQFLDVLNIPLTNLELFY